MRTDVKTVLASLRAERAAIDRAIQGLEAMDDSRIDREAAKPQSRTTSRVQTRQHAAPEIKAQVVARMRASDRKGVEAQRLAKEFGLRASTITTSWLEWERKLGGGMTIVAGNGQGTEMGGRTDASAHVDTVFA